MFLVLALWALAGGGAPIQCDNCAEWNQPQAPFAIEGNASYVGPRGLSVVMVTTSQGLVLLDGALPQSVPAIVTSIARLGHRIQEVKWIFVSHPHFDHAGGVAALARLSGARVAASPEAARALRAGRVDRADPQSGFGAKMRFAPVPRVVELPDGARTRLGDVVFTIHHTPAHAPGSAAWTWQSCQGGHCQDLVYADSLNAVSAPGFRFTDDPPRVAQFRAAIARVRALPCDVLMCPHPTFCGLLDEEGHRPPRKAGACQWYADRASIRLDERLATEGRETTP
jgi:metallo-beta-lactamase class B